MSKSRLYAIWYATIAAGFFLLGLFRVVNHEGGAWLRFLIAAGFAALALLQFQSRP